MSRTIIIGDVHGCLVELRELLGALDYQPGRDQLVFVGDYLDRGPESAATVRFIRELAERDGAIALMGNHDEKYVRWHRWQTTPQPPGSMPMTFPEEKQRIYAELSPADLAWLAARPCFHPGAGFLAVHAGISPLKHLTLDDLVRNRECRSLLLRLRDVDAAGHALKLGDVHPPDARPWWQDYDGRFGIVFHGHQSAPDIVRGPFSVGLDTGCCFGGRLTAVCFADVTHLTFHSVPAQATYFTRASEEAD